MPRRHQVHGRRNCRWLHAGLVRDNRGVIRDIWYAFPKNKKGNRKKIEYASDKEGKYWANYGAGELKRDMISWDDHHIQKVLHLLTGYGTWRRGSKMAGKKRFRQTLLETYLDHRFQDPHPNGREDRTFGPTLNVIFYEDDFSGAAPIIPRNAPEWVLEKKKCYPGSRIPLSIDGINIDAWKAVNPQHPDAKQVVIEFLTAQMAKGIFVLHAEQQLKRIESAFFELGWRIHRQALRQAQRDMKDGKNTNAFGCALWRKNPPLRVDLFKGQDIEQLMKGMRDDAIVDDDDEDDDNDDSDDESGGGANNSGNDGDQSSSEDSDSDSDPEDEPLFVPQSRSSTPGVGPSNYRQHADSALQRSILQQVPSTTPDNDADGVATRTAGQSSEDQDDDYEYLSDNSPDKDKGKAVSKTISFGMLESDSDKSSSKRPIVIDIDSDDEDVKPSFESPTKRVKTSPGPRNVIEIEDSDSEIEIDEDRSSAPAIKNERVLLKHEVVEVKDASASSCATQ